MTATSHRAARFVTARLDESYTLFGTGEHVVRERRCTFEVVAPQACNHNDSRTICLDCAASWQMDYDFDEPFPFARAARVTLADIIAAGHLQAGVELVMHDGTKAVITATGGIMLADGRVFANPSAAANAALDL
ncbi:restriction system modified-DNA reader domain-containing protein [Streptomyces roseolus]|uniref:restriction system modified-DNA reader domain-containing protein n=1 Tax=Streptomyces roseolus TaxID=67358 RepID=UPI0036481FD3